MKILILGLNFAPELTGVGRYTADFVAWLSERGHEVRVITAPPYYPEWRVGAGYAAGAWRREAMGRVRVLRCPIWLPRALTPRTRILHLLSFAMSSVVPCLWAAARFRPDLIWAVEPTACAAPTALLAARLCGGRACLHVQDLEVAAACGLGVIKGRNLQRLLRRAVGWCAASIWSPPSVCVCRPSAGSVLPRSVYLFELVDTGAIRPLRATSCAASEVRRRWCRIVRRQLGWQAGPGAAGRRGRATARTQDIRLVCAALGATTPRAHPWPATPT
jgi:colanic acid biosynthesis glycosyl transferase WcaI